MSNGTLHRYTAFSNNPAGGNPAGVWIGDALPDAATMQAIAGEVGYSETAFVAPTHGRARVIRYYSPEAEVPFCGHATIATGVVLGTNDGDGVYRLATPVGEVPVEVRVRDGRREAALTSVVPRHESASAALTEATLSTLRWKRENWIRRFPRHAPSPAPGTWCSRSPTPARWRGSITTSTGSRR